MKPPASVRAEIKKRVPRVTPYRPLKADVAVKRVPGPYHRPIQLSISFVRPVLSANNSTGTPIRLSIVTNRFDRGVTFDG